MLAARVYAGPTAADAHQLSLQVQVVKMYRDTELLLQQHAITVQWQAEAKTSRAPLQWSGQTNAWGFAEVQLELPEPREFSASQISVKHRGPSDLTPRLLAKGSLPDHLPTWAATAVESGKISGQSTGSFQLEVAIEQGALAVPFAGAIDVRATQGGKEMAGVALQLHLVGAGFIRTGNHASLTTDKRGLATAPLIARSHAVELTIEAKADDARGHARWYGALPIVPGAMHAELKKQRLLVASPIGRPHAFVRFVSRSERLASNPIALQQKSDGSATGVVLLPTRVQNALDRNEPVWAVVSSEPYSLSGGSVGWFLGPSTVTPRSTFSPPDTLVIDGLPAVQRAESERRRLAHRNGVWGALGVLFAFGLVFMVRWRRELKPPKF